jgi:nitrate reductase / nitrite oxidoreductase, beta subunit
MGKVYNWQLGRPMEFPYKDKRPKRQFAVVFNINRCIGCQTCTFACKSTWTHSPGQDAMWWNNVETKPFGGYPQGWDIKTLDLLGPQPGWEANGESYEGAAAKSDSGIKGAPYGIYAGQTLFEAALKRVSGEAQKVVGYLPEDKEWRHPNLYEDSPNEHPEIVEGMTTRGSELPEHKTFFFYLARICNHCTYAACLAACPRKAIYKREEDGIVLIDQERCRGHRKCVEACPYKKSMYNHVTGTSEKCIGCYPRLEGKDPISEGKPMITRCNSACVGKIRLQGWVDDPENPVHYLVFKEKVALPLYPQFGTEPNVYYIPPRWAPRKYLEQMFGPGVKEAIERYTNPSRELLGVLQLFNTIQVVISKYAVTEKEAIGYDDAGKELVRIPIEEPIYVRPKRHLNIT